MLEIVPPETSKGKGVKMLLDHLGVSPNEVLLSYPAITNVPAELIAYDT